MKKAMEPARHSDPKLTLKTYARVVMRDLTRGQRHNSPTVVGSGKPLRKPELVSRCAAWLQERMPPKGLEPLTR